jgi:hypothetical protein
MKAKPSGDAECGVDIGTRIATSLLRLLAGSFIS